jgi:hypothetical protein
VLTVRVPLDVRRVGRVEGGDKGVGGQVPHLDPAPQIPETADHEESALRVEQRQILNQNKQQVKTRARVTGSYLDNILNRVRLRRFPNPADHEESALRVEKRQILYHNNKQQVKRG